MTLRLARAASLPPRQRGWASPAFHPRLDVLKQAIEQKRCPESWRSVRRTIVPQYSQGRSVNFVNFGGGGFVFPWHLCEQNLPGACPFGRSNWVPQPWHK